MRAHGHGYAGSPMSRVPGSGSPSYRTLNPTRAAPAIPAVAPPGIAGVPASPAAAGHSPQPFSRVHSASMIAPPGLAAPQPSGASSGPHRLAAGQAVQPPPQAVQPPPQAVQQEGGSTAGTQQPMSAATALAKLRAARAADQTSPLQQQGGPSPIQQPTLSTSQGRPRQGIKRARGEEDEVVEVEDEELEEAGAGGAPARGQSGSNATSMGSMGAGGAPKQRGNGAVSPNNRPRPKGSSGNGPSGSGGAPGGGSAKTGTPTPSMAAGAGQLPPGVTLPPGMRAMGPMGMLPPGAALLQNVGPAGLPPGILAAQGLSAAPQALIPGLPGEVQWLGTGNN
jgi:hypothetical protein